MAEGTKIIFEFTNATGATIRHSYNYGRDNASTAAVRNYMTTAISNAAMFRNQPVAIKRAYAQVTTETDFEIEE